MSMHHVGRCDRSGCGVTAPLVPNYRMVDQQSQHWATGPTTATPAPISYSMPKGWLQIDGRDFCSWACVALHAESKVAGLAPS